jgi:hypothetical protein
MKTLWNTRLNATVLVGVALTTPPGAQTASVDSATYMLEGGKLAPTFPHTSVALHF